jgi:uncharacterized protein YqeY
MSLFDTIRSEILTATKNGDEVTKNIFKVVLSAISMIESSKHRVPIGAKVSDVEIGTIVKETLEGVNKTLTFLKESDRDYPKYCSERATLTAFMELVPKEPENLPKEAVVAALSGLVDEIKAAKSDGAATGIAMKLVKAEKLLTTGAMVSEIVKEIRTQ